MSNEQYNQCGVLRLHYLFLESQISLNGWIIHQVPKKMGDDLAKPKPVREG